MASDPKIGAEVIAKLKDDGDFDRLRLRVVRKLKDNADLRNSIVSIVKQSAALNQPGAEDMKPRELSDAIYGEIGDEVKSKISDGLWEIIRSGDGMKNEITETVQSVYNSLVNPKVKDEGTSSSPQHAIKAMAGAESNGTMTRSENNGTITFSAVEVDETMLDSEPNEPPGFSRGDHHNINNHKEQHHDELQIVLPTETEKLSGDLLNQENGDPIKPPGFSPGLEQKRLCDFSDDDPDLPPGFG